MSYSILSTTPWPKSLLTSASVSLDRGAFQVEKQTRVYVSDTPIHRARKALGVSRKHYPSGIVSTIGVGGENRVSSKISMDTQSRSRRVLD